MSQSVHLHSYCAKHSYVFISDAGMNPRWVDTTLPMYDFVRRQLEIERPYGHLHIRLCQRCADELIAQATGGKKTFSATL